ncbi:hypothetical protein PENTCL1PPCAC_17769, partial [Pristionchus entomophagus]
DDDDIFLSIDFDPEQALREKLSPGVCDDSIEIFEKFLLEEDEELAKLILEEENGDEKIVLSKKEEKRQREERLKNMMKGERELFEQKKKRNNDTVLEKMKKMAGPLAELARAVTNGKKIEIRCRNLNRIDRVMRGVPVAFDKHWNVVLREAVDCQKPSRSQGGIHITHRSILPQFAQWVKPDPPFNLYRRRVMPCSFVKGDTICLIRLL